MHDSSIIDLHCHSTASDGTYAPKEVAALAQKIGLSAIALTDHDTIDGLAEFQAAGNALGIEAIAGIEFAALWEHFHRPEIHIVGLGFDPAHPVLLPVISPPVCRAMWSGNFSLLPFASKPSRRQAARRFWRILRFMSWM